MVKIHAENAAHQTICKLDYLQNADDYNGVGNCGDGGEVLIRMILL